MSSASRAFRSPLVVVVAVAGLGVLVGMVLIGSRLAGALTAPNPPSVTASAAVRLTAVEDGVDATLTLTGQAGVALPDAAMRPFLDEEDDGTTTTTERTVDEPLVTDVTSTERVRPDSIVVRWHADPLQDGARLLVLPAFDGVELSELRVSVVGARVASCHVQFRSVQGHPRMRGCANGLGTSIVLVPPQDPLDRVRLRLG